MAREPLIDLGLLAPDGAPAPAAHREWVPWRGFGRWRRPTLVWSVTALLVAVMTGSGIHRDPPVSLAAPASGRFEVVGDLLFVASDHRLQPDAGQPSAAVSSFHWTAHDVSTGEPLWTLRQPGDRLELVATRGLLWHRGMALDPATGSWRLPQLARLPNGFDYTGVPGGETLVLTGGYRPYSDNTVDTEFSYEVVGVDAKSGVERWRDHPDPGVEVWLGGDPPTLVTISGDELVSIRDPDTGRVRASRRIPGATVAELAGELLLVQVWEPGVGGVRRAYAPETMAPLWEQPEPAGPLEQCGPMLCHYLTANPARNAFDRMSGDSWEVPRTTVVLDPATGQLAWVTSHRLYPVGERFLSYGDTGELRAIRDARTGWRMRDLTGWQAVVPPFRSVRGAAPGAGPEAVTLLRTGTGRTEAARLDLATGALTGLGELPAEPVRCQPYSHGVVCLHADQIRVWPL